MSTNDSKPRTSDALLGPWSRRGLVAASVLMVAALLVTSWSGYQSVQEASALLVHGLGDKFLQTLRESGRMLRRPLNGEEMQELIDAHADEGLRFLAFIEADGSIIASAGTASVDPAVLVAELAMTPPGSMTHIGDRVRLVGAPRPRPHYRGRPGPRHHVVVEYEPLVATALVDGAARTFAVGAAVALALVLLTLLLVRWLLRQEALERALERGKRLAALGEMSAVLAHEIRNPLASLKGNAQLLVEVLPVASSARPKADRVVNEAVRLEKLTNDLLEYVRSGRIDRHSADPSLLLRAAVETLASDRIDVHDDGAPEQWLLDPVHVGQVLTNLLDNALQASPSHARVQATVTRQGQNLVYLVRDQGEGLPRGEEARIFEPFHTTRVHGTGLGLAVARRLVESHGGTLTARNHPDGGAEMLVTIPSGNGS